MRSLCRKSTKAQVFIKNAPFQSDPTTVGNYLLDKLYALGVTQIFAIPGDYALRFNKLIEMHPHIQYIGATRENTAGYMADGYARMKGLGVACITYGVGINIANATAKAYVESVPLIIISGAAGKEEFKKCHELHHLINTTTSRYRDNTQKEIFKQITVAQITLDDPNTAADEIDRVIEQCLKHKKPVYIEIPRDMVDVSIKEHVYQPHLPEKSPQNRLKEAVDAVFAILKQSRQPVIWLGHELGRLSLTQEILKFAETANIPIATTLLGKTVIDERHPLFIGVYLGDISRPEVVDYINDCDCVLALGVIFNDVDTGAFTVELGKAKQIIVNQEGVLVGSCSYQGLYLKDFVTQLKERSREVEFDTAYPSMQDRPIATFDAKSKMKITTTRLFECIEANLSPSDIIVTDFGDALFGCMDFILGENSFISSAYFATLGFGAPGSIGVQLACPNQRVVGVIGDGAFQMTCTELSTAVRYGVNPIIIVLNNHGYGTERPLLEGAYNDIQDWNYAALPKLFNGGIGIEVKTEEEFEKAFKRASADNNNLYIIEVELDKTDFSPAMQRFSKVILKQKRSVE